MNTREQALELHAMGLQVVPALSPRAHKNFKRPALPAWTQYQDALVPREQAEEWFGPGYAGNVGIVTGRCSGGVFIVDIDNDEGLRWWYTLCKVHNNGLTVDCPVVTTPRGGRHLYFREPPGWTAPTIKGPGVDIRGRGGFVMCPPSIGDRGEYLWRVEIEEVGIPYMPKWGCDAIDALSNARQQVPAAVIQSAAAGTVPRHERGHISGHTNGHANGAGGGVVYSAELHKLGQIVDGREGHLLKMLAAAHADYVRENGCTPTAQDLAEIVWPVVQAKYDLTRAGEDGQPYDYSRVLRGAAKLERRVEAGRVQDLSLDALTAEAQAGVTNLGSPAPHNTSETKDGSYTPINSSQNKKDFAWLTRTNASIVLDASWLIKKLLPADGLGVIYGRPGSGKTFTCLDLALHVALGRTWRGLKVERKAVSYVSPEAGRLGANRVIGWCLYNKEQWPDAFRLSPVGINLRSSADDAIALIADIKANQPDCGLIIIDTLNRAMAGGDENSSEDMGAFVGMCDAVAKATGALVLIVHHSGKDAAKGSRGHSSLLGAVSVELEVMREQGMPGTMMPGTIKNTKQRDGEDGAEYGFNLQSVTLGVDRDREEVTTAVAVEARADEARAARAAGPSGAIQKHVARAFEQYVDDHGVPNPGGTGFPEPGTVRCVRTAEFMQYAAEKMVGERPEYQCKRAVENLIGKGHFAINGGLIWMPR